MEIHGKTRLLGLLGDPVQHTMSPLIHNTLSDILEINEVYVPFHTHKEGLADAVKGAFELNILGMNATVPHKSEIMASLVDIDEGAAAIGAINTLVRTANGYKGYNTDMMGCPENWSPTEWNLTVKRLSYLAQAVQRELWHICA